MQADRREPPRVAPCKWRGCSEVQPSDTVGPLPGVFGKWLAPWRTVAAVVLLFGALVTAARADEMPAARRAVAVIVNPSNPTTDLSLDQLRAIFALEHQFWANGRRIVVLLPPLASPERATLLQKVYAVTEAELRKSWVARLFQGDIPAVPAVLRAGTSAVSEVAASQAAVAVVDAEIATKLGAVRVVRIDHLLPSDDGYPLVVDTVSSNPRGPGQAPMSP